MSMEMGVFMIEYGLRRFEMSKLVMQVTFFHSFGNDATGYHCARETPPFVSCINKSRVNRDTVALYIER